MGWERGYYYRVHKVKGRVVREYVGTGWVAELAAQTDALEREKRQRAVRELRQQKAELAALDADIKTMGETTELAGRAALLAAGYHQHKRGEWRKNVSKTSLAVINAAPMAGQEIVALAVRAQNGDVAALPALRDLLEEPAAVDILGGDLARRAQRTLVEKLCGQNLLLKESVTRKLDLMRFELAGPNPTPLERLLVERIVACWLHLHHLETCYAERDLSLELDSHYQRSIDRAQKRYLAAIKTLAVIRKLALPALQLNIARKQVNVVAPP